MWLGKNFYFKSRHISKVFGLCPAIIGTTLKDHIPDSIVSIYSQGSREIIWLTHFGDK